MLNAFAAVVGQKAQGCWLGYGSVLFLEFGELHPLEHQTHPRGEWSLSSARILWRIEQDDSVLGGSEDDRPTMEAAIEYINGNTLVAGELLEASGDSVLTFSGRVVLKTFVLSSAEDSRWHLTLADGSHVSLGTARSGMGTVS